MRDVLNPDLFTVAEWRLRGEAEKRAFIPAGGDPSQGGGPPPGMDPSQGGGPPPGMDPSAMAGGGMPPPPPPAPAPAPAAAPAPGQPGAAPAKAKIDPAFIYLELSRIRKCLTHMMRATGIDLPPDVLDDQTVAQVVAGQQPQSTPIGQDDSAQTPPSLPGIGGQGSIGPVQSPTGEKQGSVASLFTGPVDSDFNSFSRRMDALAALSRSLGRI